MQFVEDARHISDQKKDLDKHLLSCRLSLQCLRHSLGDYLKLAIVIYEKADEPSGRSPWKYAVI